VTITLTSDPIYPVPGAVRLTATVSADANFLRLWVTDAPRGSRYLRNIETRSTAQAARVLAVEVDAGAQFELDLDVGGRYTFAGQEYDRGASTHGGGYSRDPDAFPSEVVRGAEQTITLDVGQRLVSPIGAPAYGTADLVLWVWTNHIRSTTVERHGELSPAIAGQRTDRAHTAARAATVDTALAALIDVTAATAIGDLQALHADLRTKVPAHFNNTGGAYHNTVDSNNDTEIEQLPVGPATPEGYVFSAEILRRRLHLHMSNDLSDSTRQYHGATPKPDWEHALMAIPPGAANMSTALAAYADVAEQYKVHIAATAYHAVVDGTNGLTAATPPLADVHRLFLAAQRAYAPTAAPDVNPAAALLIHQGGFQEVNR
jgi:hypothetical protein